MVEFKVRTERLKSRAKTFGSTNITNLLIYLHVTLKKATLIKKKKKRRQIVCMINKIVQNINFKRILEKKQTKTNVIVKLFRGRQ